MASSDCSRNDTTMTMDAMLRCVCVNTAGRCPYIAMICIYNNAIIIMLYSCYTRNYNAIIRWTYNRYLERRVVGDGQGDQRGLFVLSWCWVLLHVFLFLFSRTI